MIVQNFTDAQYTNGQRTIGSIYFEKFSLLTVQTGKFLLCQFFSMTGAFFQQVYLS